MRQLAAISLVAAIVVGVFIVGFVMTGLRVPVPAFLTQDEDFDPGGEGFFAAVGDLLDRTDLSDEAAVEKVVERIWELTEDPRRRPKRGIYYSQLLALARQVEGDTLAARLVDKMATSLGRTGDLGEIYLYQRDVITLLRAKRSRELLSLVLDTYEGPLAANSIIDGSPRFFGNLLRDVHEYEGREAFEWAVRRVFRVYGKRAETKVFDTLAEELLTILRTFASPEPVLRTIRLVNRDLAGAGHHAARVELAESILEKPWTPDFRRVRLEALATLAVASAEDGNPSRSVIAASELAREVRGRGAEEELLAALTWGQVRAVRGEAVDAREHFRRAWALAQKTGSTNAEWRALYHQSVYYAFEGQLSRAMAGFRGAMERIEALGDDPSLEESVVRPLEVYASAITMAAKRGDWGTGYALTHRARAYATGREAPDDPDLLADLQEELEGRNAVVVEYLVVPGRLLAWYIAEKTASLTEISIREPILGRRVADLNGAISFGLDGADARAEALFELLLHRELLPPAGGRVLIVPSGPLHDLPFGALRSDGVTLAERYAVEVVEAAQERSDHAAPRERAEPEPARPAEEPKGA